MAGLTNITQNMNPSTGGGYVKEPTNDQYANKCYTEWELAKKSCWTWGARIESLSKTHCPTKSEIMNVNYNTIYATSTLNNGTSESNYNIFADPGVSNTKLVKRSLLASTSSVNFVINVNHNLNLKPDDYTISVFLSNHYTSKTNVCSLGSSVTVDNADVGATGWHDYRYNITVKSLLNSSDSAINRDAYICMTIGNSNWSYPRDFYITTLYWTGSAWAEKVARKRVGVGAKTVTFNTGAKWRDVIGNRYRFKFELVTS